MAAATTTPPEQLETPHAGGISVERSYFRSVLIAWVAGIPVIGAFFTILVLAVSDYSFGAALGIGLFGGVWVSPLAGVIGIGVWASRHHGPHGETT